MKAFEKITTIIEAMALLDALEKSSEMGHILCFNETRIKPSNTEVFLYVDAVFKDTDGDLLFKGSYQFEDGTREDGQVLRDNLTAIDLISLAEEIRREYFDSFPEIMRKNISDAFNAKEFFRWVLPLGGYEFGNNSLDIPQKDGSEKCFKKVYMENGKVHIVEQDGTDITVTNKHIYVLLARFVQHIMWLEFFYSGKYRHYDI